MSLTPDSGVLIEKILASMGDESSNQNHRRSIIHQSDLGSEFASLPVAPERTSKQPITVLGLSSIRGMKEHRVADTMENV